MSKTIQLDSNKIKVRYDPENRLEGYLRLLLKENERVNLVSRETDLESALRLALESVLPLDYLPNQVGSYLDIGSGGGLPAIPLLLSGRINGPALLIDKIQKKCSALNRILTALGLVAEILPVPFPSRSINRTFDLITLRWVRLDPDLLSSISRSLSPQGCFLHYSSEPLSSELFSRETYLFDDSQTGVIKGFTLYQKN